MPGPNPQNIPLSLYIHIPWCVRKCPYCDFNSHEGNVEEQAYVAALMADLEQDLALVGDRAIHSIFFGGGTPSLFSGQAIQSILDGVRSRIALESDCEITLEANPGTIEQARFDGYRAAGVNRLSIGIQSFDAEKLQALGRIHTADEALKAAATARAAGFDNFNLDLMFALPKQTVDEALADIEQALALKPTHLSHYHLTLEPNTVFAKYPPANLPNEELAWDIQDACHKKLHAAGYQNYEVSAWAQANKRCAHNLNYWRFGDYLGIGAGAHGKVTAANGEIFRQSKKKTPAHFLRDAGSAAAVAESQSVPAKELAFEYMLNRLRLAEPFSLNEVERYSGLSSAALQASLAAAQEKQLLSESDGQWSRTSLGASHLNSLTSIFL